MVIKERIRYFYNFDNVYDKDGFSVTQVMNLFFKSYRGYFFFFLFMTCISSCSNGFAQSGALYLTPWIQEINIPAPSHEIANTSLYPDHRGYLLLGKENGIFVMDGRRSSQFLMKGPVYITGDQSDTLIYAARGDVGYLVPDQDHLFKPLSRKHWIPASQRDFTPSGLQILGDHIFILSDRGVLSLKEGSFQLHEFRGIPRSMYVEKNQLYLLLENKGGYVWERNGFKPWTGAGMMANSESDGRPGWLIAEKPEGVYPLYKGFLVIEEDQSGIAIYSSNGKILNKLGSRGGLPDKEIRQIFSNEGHEIWILAAHSLHKISYPSPLNTLDLSSSGTGRILNSTLIGDTLYIGTSNGLWRVYRAEKGSDLMMLESMLSGLQESVHLLSAQNDQLFAAGLHHLFIISNDQSEPLGSGSFTGIAALGPDSVVAGTQNGIFIYRKGKSDWFSEIIDTRLSSATSFVHHQGQVYFLCDNEIYRLAENLGEVEQLSFQPADMILRLVSLEGALYLVSSEKVYRFDANEKTFLPVASSDKAGIIARSDDLLAVSDGSVWQVQHQGKYRSEVSHYSEWDEEEIKATHFPVFGNLGEIIRLSCHDSVLYITGKEGISLFDLAYLQVQKPVNQIDIIELPGGEEDRSFYLSGMAFQSAPEPLFRHRLAPLHEDWSEWNTNRRLTLKGLKHGKYRLEAQALDLYGRVTPVAQTAFELPSPYFLRWYAFLFYGIVLLMVLFLIQKWRLLSYQKAESTISRRLQAKIDQMALEKAKSDKLAAEFLPEQTAEEIKNSGRARWKKYERATVLFSDIQGFTKIAEEMNPEALIDELDTFFFHFDSVVEKYNIEKIKTIGDAYMAAGGIPEKNSTNPVEVVLAAIEMQAYMAQLKASRTKIWDLRIGIHTGPVIAGVVGHKKVSYDIWGDTVNTASRMESSGTAGKVNISGITYGMVKEYFICEYRGKLPVKYKGNIDMYFVRGLRPELSVDLKAIPNKRFFTKLQLLRLADVEEKVFEDILSRLPDSFHFHRSDHARRVYDQSFILSRAQEVEQEERLLVRTAALMLFTGLTHSYNNFENSSVEITREILPHYQYSEKQIDQVCNLILSTKMPFQPGNLLEKIVIDARMEYLGCTDYTRKIELLYQELRESGVKINGQQFKHQQIELLHEFEFFTLAARRLREVSGPEQMTNLEKERWI